MVVWRLHAESLWLLHAAAMSAMPPAALHPRLTPNFQTPADLLPSLPPSHRYNNVMMDADKQQQLEMFLGLKLAHYLPATRLPYRDDPGLPLDFPETDDEEDAVGALSWPQQPGLLLEKRSGATAMSVLGELGSRMVGKSSSQGSLLAAASAAELKQLPLHHGAASTGELLLLDDELGTARAATLQGADELPPRRQMTDPLGLL